MPAVRDFGLFTALLVIACWVIDILLMPSALCIWSLYLEERENRFSDRVLRRIRCYKAKASSWLPRLPRDLEVHLSDTSYRDVPVRNDTEFSSALTNVVEFPDISDGSEMREIGPYAREDFRKIMDKISETNQSNDIESVENIETSQLGSLPSIIQRFIYYYIARKIMRAKRACIVIFAIILTTTAVIVCTQLKTATKLPRFFGDGTNLQTLINIRYNITSDSNLDCFTCSGIFIPPMPRATNPPPTTVATTSTVTPAPTTFVYTTQPSTTNSTTIATTSQPTNDSTVNSTVEDTTSSTTDSGTLEPLTSSSPATSDHTSSPSKVTTARVTTTQKTIPTSESISPSSSANMRTQSPGTTKPSITTAQTRTVVTATDDPSINPCKENCNPIAQPPAMDNTAIINVVFGIKGIDNTNSSTNSEPGKTEVL